METSQVIVALAPLANWALVEASRKLNVLNLSEAGKGKLRATSLALSAAATVLSGVASGSVVPQDLHGLAATAGTVFVVWGGMEVINNVSGWVKSLLAKKE